MKAAYSLLILAFVTVNLTAGVKEDVEHGSGKHNPIKHEHYHDGEHDPHFDHEAILGNRQLEKEFDDLEPEEAKRRLKLLVKDIDTDKDGFVSNDELTKWIISSFQKLDAEDAEEQFQENDENSDGKITWKEYISKQYGYNPEDMSDFHERDAEDLDDFTKMIDEDKLKFDAADVDKDGQLDNKEHVAFVYPYDFKHMHEVEMAKTMAEHDKNKDGIISKDEFLNQGVLAAEEHDREWILVEEERFGEYDHNKDGQLDKEEIIQWVLPDNMQAAEEEAEHLIGKSDDNKDGKLSEEEILDHHDDFVGSQASNYGAYLPKDEL